MEINGGSLRYTAEIDISKLKAALKEGEKGYQGFSDVVGKTGDEMDKAFENAQKVIENQKKSITELEKKYQELQNTINNTPSESGNSALADEMVRLKAEIDTYEKGMANMQKVLESYTNKNIVLTKELDELKRKLVDVGKAQVENQKLTDTLDITSENIKIQKQAIADLEKQYKDLEKTIEGIAPGQAKANLMGDAAELAKEIEAEKQALIELQNYVGVTAERHESLRQKLNQVKNEMIALAAAGQQNTGEYAQLAQEADTLQTAIDEVNGTMDALSGNTGLNAIVEGLGLASSGMAIYQGAVALTGVESKNLEEIMVRLQAVMAISIGIQQVQNTLTRQGALIQSVIALQATARARAEALATSNTIAATVAQRAFNLVANANPYVLLATAIITVVGALALMSSGNKRAAEDQKKLNDAIADGAAEQIVSYKKLQNQYNELGDSLQEKNKFIEENQDKFHDLGIEIENTADAEVVFRSGETAMINSLMLRAEAAANAQIAIEKYKEALKEEGEIRNFDEDWKNSGFFGKIGLGFKASFNNIDNNKPKQRRKEADANIKSEIDLYKKSAKELEKAKIKTEASGPAKGSEEFYRAEISRLNHLKSKAQVGSKEWENYRKEIERLDSLVNPKEKKTKKPAKAKELAEVFDVGSLARLQQQISLIDNSIQRMGKDGLVSLRALDQYGKEYTSNQVISLEEAKNKRLELSNQVAEIEKNIQIKSITDQVNESNKLWEQYYAAVQSLGEEAANRIYGKLIENGKTQFDSLVDMQKQLSTKTILTDEDKDVLLTINSAIDAMLGKQSALDKFKSDIENTLSTMNSDAERLLFIQEKLKNSTSADKSEGRTAFLAENERNIIKNEKEAYNNLLKEHQAFAQKKILIEKKTSEAIAKIKDDTGLSEEQKKSVTGSIDKKSKEEISQLAVDELTQSQAWMALYGNIDDLTAYQMDVLLRELESKQGNLAKVLTRVDFRILLKNFRDVKNKISEENPFLGMFNSLQELFSAFGAQSEQVGEQAYTSFERASEGIRGTLNATKGIIGAISPAREYLSDTANDAIDTIEQVVTMGIGMMQAVDGTVKAVSSAIKSATWSNWITALIQIIYTAIRAIVSLFTWIAGNKTKKINKQIKEYQSVLNGLEQTYNDLALAAEKAYGSMKYDVQRESIKNLQEQQKVLEDMKEAESKKKKADQAKIDSYNDQQQENIRKIEDLKNEILRDVLQTDVPEMASRIGDALIEAFGKGVDGIEGINKAFDDMIKNVMRNQLNKVLEKQFAPIYDNLLKAAGFDKDGNGSFDGLTKEEIEALRAQVLAASAQGKDFIKAYSELFEELDLSAPESLKGDIKGVTEKTAGALEGQVNAVRINQVSGLQVARQSLLNLVKIEANTRNLYQIRKDISEMNSKMKKSLAGVP